MVHTHQGTARCQVGSLFHKFEKDRNGWCCASFPGKAEGVTVEGAAATAENGAPEEELEPDVMADDDDDDDDLDLFGDMTEEEKAAAEEKKRAIEAKKEKAKANALKAKSMIIIDVKPWDDTTGLSPRINRQRDTAFQIWGS